MKSIIEIKQLSKTYSMGTINVHALRDVDLSVQTGEFLAVMGPSGSGKSTLMNLLGCLDQPSSGDYYLDGKYVNTMSADEYADIRNQKIGFVFQGFNLLPRTTALENVELPLFYDRQSRFKNPRESALKALDRVGLSDRLDHIPNQLSGGQQQRVAIARALVNEPAIIFADEPTGNLDSRTSMEIFSLFQELNDDGITIVMVTHERDFAFYAKRIIEMHDGQISQDIIISKRRNANVDLARYLRPETEEIVA